MLRIHHQERAGSRIIAKKAVTSGSTDRASPEARITRRWRSIMPRAGRSAPPAAVTSTYVKPNHAPSIAIEHPKSQTALGESPGCSCLVTTIRSARGFRCQLPRAPSSRPPGFHSSCASERPPAAARNPVPKRETEHENEQDIMVRQPSVVSRVWRATARPMQSQQRALVTGSEQRFFI